MISNYHQASPSSGPEAQYNYSFDEPSGPSNSRPKSGKDKQRRGFFGRKKRSSSRNGTSEEMTVSSAASAASSSMAYSYTDSEQSAGESTNSSVFCLLKELENTNGHKPREKGVTRRSSGEGSFGPTGLKPSSKDGKHNAHTQGSKVNPIPKPVEPRLLGGDDEESSKGEENLFGSSIFQPAQPRDRPSKKKSKDSASPGKGKYKGCDGVNASGSVVSSSNTSYIGSSLPTTETEKVSEQRTTVVEDFKKGPRATTTPMKEVATSKEGKHRNVRSLPRWASCLDGAWDGVASESLRDFRKAARPFLCGVI